MGATMGEKVMRVLLGKVGDRENVVRECVVELSAALGSDRHASVFTVALAPPDDGGEFMNWENVTTAMLLGWAREAVGTDEWAARANGCAAFLEEMIAQQQHQPARWVDVGG